MIRRLVVSTIMIVYLLCPRVEANQANVSTVKETIVKQSIELGIDPALALSIAKSESGFRHEARSRDGAVGVFQLMPSTAKRLGVNPYYLSSNIKGGLMYYKKLHKMFGSTELALAAYNAGPGVVRRYNNKVPPIGETKRFISRIMTEYNRQKVNPDPAIIKMRAKRDNTGVKDKLDVAKAKPIEVKAAVNLESKKEIKAAEVNSVHPKNVITKKEDSYRPQPKLPAQGVV